jgi:hypothetical protein
VARTRALSILSLANEGRNPGKAQLSYVHVLDIKVIRRGIALKIYFKGLYFIKATQNLMDGMHLVYSGGGLSSLLGHLSHQELRVY